MRKQIIAHENAIVLEALKDLHESLPVNYLGDFKFTRLRTCNAKVATFSDYAILVSYGYTATSASHIAKFAHDYEVKESHTWREL